MDIAFEIKNRKHICELFIPQQLIETVNWF